MSGGRASPDRASPPIRSARRSAGAASHTHRPPRRISFREAAASTAPPPGLRTIGRPTAPGGDGASTGFTRNLGTDLRNDHPISLTYNSLLATRDGELRPVDGAQRWPPGSGSVVGDTTTTMRWIAAAAPADVFHAYVAANCWQILANHPDVDGRRIGIVGHSYGGKWAMFASCLYDKFACAAYSDPGIVFDEARPNVNYWEPWYIGWQAGFTRRPGVPSQDNPRTGPYKMLYESGRDLHELLALMAPRPLLVSGGAEDTPQRWTALNHVVAVNRLLGLENRVAMTHRPGHNPTEQSNEQV